MDEATTAPTTSGRADSGGRRVKKKGGQKIGAAQHIETEEEAEAGSAAVRRRE